LEASVIGGDEALDDLAFEPQHPATLTGAKKASVPVHRGLLLRAGPHREPTRRPSFVVRGLSIWLGRSGCDAHRSRWRSLRLAEHGDAAGTVARGPRHLVEDGAGGLDRDRGLVTVDARGSVDDEAVV